jgi:hypothetical protein
MTDDLVTRARRAVEYATKGRPVQYSPNYCPEAKDAPPQDWDTSHDLSVIRPDGNRYRIGSFRHAHDAAFDHAARELVPMMADRIETLEAQLESTLKDRARILAERDKTFDRMRALLTEAASDLESYINGDYPADTRGMYPDIQRRYDRDMEFVRRIRAELKVSEE